MKFELVITDEENEIKTYTLFESQDYKKLIEDLQMMKGININQEMFTNLKIEMKNILKHHVDLINGKNDANIPWEWDKVQ